MSQTARQTPDAAPARPVKIAAGGVKKARNEGAKVITANDLLTGRVVYWTAERSWTESLERALVVEGDRALAELALATADEARSVGPYLMDVEPGGIPSGRARLRETIRLAGPTISLPGIGA